MVMKRKQSELRTQRAVEPVKIKIERSNQRVEIGRACRMHEEKRYSNKVFVGKPERKRLLQRSRR
jgi:hypothetical protein